MPAEKRIVVLGASGYTGTLIARELKRAGAPLLLAARNPRKLQQLAGDLGGVESMVADVRDRDSLDAAAQRARVLVNCVGPFVDLGEPVVRAAIAAGAHYIDITGEQPFLRSVLIHDTWARSQNVAVVPALAFEIALTDCGSEVAIDGFEEVEAIHITYALRFQASRGTRRTALRMVQGPGLVYAGGRWVEEAPAARAFVVEFPEPAGRVSAVSFPSAEIVTIPQHIATPEVRTFVSVPRTAAPLLWLLVTAGRTLLRSPLGALAARLVGNATDGPDEKTRKHHTFHILIDVRGRHGGQPVRRKLLLRGRDPYGLTAAIVRQGAMRMLEPGYNLSGVLAPARAFEPRSFLDGLQSEHVTYEPLAE